MNDSGIRIESRKQVGTHGTVGTERYLLNDINYLIPSLPVFLPNIIGRDIKEVGTVLMG
jgi:hypothetical protein